MARRIQAAGQCCQRFGLSLLKSLGSLRSDERGGVFVEYLLLLTIVGIGAIAGLAVVRGALIAELFDLAGAIDAISP